MAVNFIHACLFTKLPTSTDFSNMFKSEMKNKYELFDAAETTVGR